MDGIPFFDCNAHPTITGQWPTQQRDASFEKLEPYLRSEDILGICAVGLWNIEAYNHKTFISKCRTHPKLIPIAGFAPNQSKNIGEEISYLKTLGYKGIKIHPASCNTNFVHHKQEMIKTLQACHTNGLVVMICTYLSTSLEKLPDADPLWALISILKASPSTKVILIHGGVTRLLEFSELARFNPNILLDLSFTLMKFKDSSLALDMKYLIKNLDQRICIGTDFPEYNIDEVRQSVSDLVETLPKEKVENICFKNISKCFNLPID